MIMTTMTKCEIIRTYQAVRAFEMNNVATLPCETKN